MGWTRGRAAGTAVITTVFSAAGLAVAITPASADIGTDLPYICTTPSGTRKINVRVAGDAPNSASVGKTVRFGGIKLTLEIPADAVGALTGVESPPVPSGPQADGLRGSSRLSVVATQNGQSVDAGWPSFPAGEVEIAGNGALEITGTGSVPPLIPSVPGDIRLTSGPLTLSLSRTGNGDTSQPTPVTCAPVGGTTIATIGVTGAGNDVAAKPRAGGAPSSTAAAPAAEDEDTRCRELTIPAPGEGFNPDPELDIFGLDVRPDEAQWSKNPGFPFCIKLSGFANTKKLKGAIPVAAGSLARRGLQTKATVGTTAVTQQRGIAVALPRESTATLLGFGFMPTTTTALVEQVAGAQSNGSVVGNFHDQALNILSDPNLPPNRIEDKIVIKAFVSVRAKGASVNGTPIALGTRCRTANTKLEVASDLGNPFVGRVIVTDGGRYSGKLDIPAFSGCGVGEDLSPLLTATASGSDNFVGIEAGQWCNPANISANCLEGRPEAPEPVTVSINPGGEFTATARPFVIRRSQNPPAQIRCESAVMKFKLKGGRWQTRMRRGEVTDFKIAGCKSQPRDLDFTLVPADVKRMVNFSYNRVTQQAQMLVEGIRIQATGPEGCKIAFGSSGTGGTGLSTFRGSYNKPTYAVNGSVLAPTNENNFAVIGSACNRLLPEFRPFTPVIDPETASFVFDPLGSPPPPDITFP